MEHFYAIAALWLGLAVLSSVIAYHLRISIALIEICVGIVAGTTATFFGVFESLGANQEWLQFLASTGTLLITCLAGTELDPETLETKLKEISIVGLVSFLAPFFLCTVIARYVLHWDSQASLLCGLALSTTAISVVYAVMLETGFNKIGFGKGILGSCFVTNLGTVVGLGLFFAPFTYKTIVFIVATAFVLFLLPRVSHWLTGKYAYRTSAIRTKWVLFVLFGLGALALWSGSEAVLPAYLVGIVLAEFSAKDAEGIKRARSLTMGFLTPFYFIRAGTLVSLPVLATAPLTLLVLLVGNLFSKIVSLYPVIGYFRRDPKERWYYTLLMSAGLTFGIIAAIFGLSHQIITQEQYSFLVATVIASAVIPAVLASVVFLPRHLLDRR